MAVPGRLTVSMDIAGVRVSGVISKTEEVGERISIDVPAGITTELTTRTSATVGVLTLATGHGLTVSDKITLTWSTGVITIATVSATTATTLSVTASAGSDLPIVGTNLVASKKVVHNTFFSGTSLVMFAVSSPLRTLIDFNDEIDALIFSYDLPNGEIRYWVKDSGVANPFTTEEVPTITVSNGTTSATTIELGFLKSSN